jgi:multidrug resistance efflux pump
LDQLPVSSIQSLLDDVQSLKVELDRVQELNRKEIESNFVPKSKYDKSIENLELAEKEVMRLRNLEALYKSSLAKCQEQVMSASKLMIGIRNDSRCLRTKCENDVQIAMQFLESVVPSATLDCCRDEIRRLRDEHDRLQKLLGGSVSRAQHESALDQVRNLEAELERVRRGMESMVPRAELATQVDVAAGQAAEIERLNLLVKSMVPRAHLDAANDALQTCRSDVKRLDALLAGMVKRAELESARDESSELLAKLNRAQGLLHSMVPRSELERFQDDVLASTDLVRSLRAELQRMKARCESNLTRLMEALQGMASPMTVARVRDDVQRMTEECDCLKRLVQGMVPRAHLDITQRELENLKWEVDQLRRKLEISVPRVQLAEALAEVEALRAELAASKRVQGSIRLVSM